MNGHIGDDAALYALGALDAREQRAVEEHAARCAPCAERLAAVSDDVAAMASLEPQHAAPPALGARIAATLERGGATAIKRPGITRWSAAFAAAAALIVLAVAPSAYLWQQNRSMHETMLAESAAMARIATSPHRTVAFASITNARVMYGPDGSWYCIVVRGIHAPVQVAWKHGGSMTMLGTAVPHGDVAMLYLPKSHRMERLELMEDSNVMGEAQLIF